MVLETKHVNQRQRDEFHPCSLLAVSAGPPGSGFLTWKTEIITQLHLLHRLWKMKCNNDVSGLTKPQANENYNFIPITWRHFLFISHQPL